MDLSTLSVPELKSLLEVIPNEIARREKEEKARVRRELEEIAQKSGYSLNDIFGSDPEKAAKTKKAVAVKYRHPDDVSLGWTGRGRQPRWVVEFLASGGSLDQIAL